MPLRKFTCSCFRLLGLSLVDINLSVTLAPCSGHEEQQKRHNLISVLLEPVMRLCLRLASQLPARESAHNRVVSLRTVRIDLFEEKLYLAAWSDVRW